MTVPVIRQDLLNDLLKYFSLFERGFRFRKSTHTNFHSKSNCPQPQLSNDLNESV